VGAGHVDRLYHAAPSPVHRLRPECKLVAALAFVLVVVLTPREEFLVFGGYAVLLAAVAAAARIPAGLVARRMLVEVPFVLFAVAMPFIARGERVDVLGVAVSVEGMYGAWNVLAKATLGVVCSILLAATTEFRDLLVGLQRLRMPQLLVQIMTFMVRYSDVVADEMRRMRIARESRGFVARDLRQLSVVARSAGALFIRCYERGERVHLAMLSRGYDGRLPASSSAAASTGQWTRALTLPAVALLVAAVGGVASW
jgi:cobalt/nickel transport system permease protein